MTLSSIELHIEALELDCPSAVDGRRIGAALTAALVRRIEVDGLPRALRAGGVSDDIDLGPLVITFGQRPEAIGVLLAGTVYDGLNR